MPDDVKPGAKGEPERKQAELEALVAGLTTEVSRVYDKLDRCEERLAELILFLKSKEVSGG